MKKDKKHRKIKRIGIYFYDDLAEKIENDSKKLGVSEGVFVRIMVIKGLENESH